jgi:tetratricopeptide (TPR) repeat protein
VMVLIELAHTNFALQWYRKAGQLLEHANRLTPNRSEILIDLGIIYWHENRRNDAEKCFSEAAKHHDGKQASLVNTGNITLLSGDLDMAIKAYQKAHAFGRNNAVVLYNLAMAYLEKGDRKKAVRYLDELQLLVPGRVDLLIIRAKIAIDMGNTADAEVAYRRILEKDPFHPLAIDGLIKLLLAQKRFEEAVFRLEGYLETMPARGDLMLLLADAYREQEWFEVAIVKYQLVLRDFPDYGAGFLGLARCKYEMIKKNKTNEFDDALYALKQASEKVPESPDPHIMMADIYRNYKHYVTMAVEQWQLALKKTTDRNQRKKIEEQIAAAGK